MPPNVKLVQNLWGQRCGKALVLPSSLLYTLSLYFEHSFNFQYMSIYTKLFKCVLSSSSGLRPYKYTLILDIRINPIPCFLVRVP